MSSRDEEIAYVALATKQSEISCASALKICGHLNSI